MANPYQQQSLRRKLTYLALVLVLISVTLILRELKSVGLKAQAGDIQGALDVAQKALGHPHATLALQAHLYDLSGDLTWRIGRHDEAAASWRSVLGASGPQERESALVTAGNQLVSGEPTGLVDDAFEPELVAVAHN